MYTCVYAMRGRRSRCSTGVRAHLTHSLGARRRRRCSNIIYYTTHRHTHFLSPLLTSLLVHYSPLSLCPQRALLSARASQQSVAGRCRRWLGPSTSCCRPDDADEPLPAAAVVVLLPAAACADWPRAARIPGAKMAIELSRGRERESSSGSADVAQQQQQHTQSTARYIHSHFGIPLSRGQRWLAAFLALAQNPGEDDDAREKDR